MATDDIYKSKARYERMINNFEDWLIRPAVGKQKIGRRRYFIRNKVNVKYFYKILDTFDMKDQSYVRRCRMLNVLLVISYVPDKDLKECAREDINKIVAFMHTRNKTVESKKDFIKDIKCIWRILFPETDIKGRPDETVMPYVVRHLSRKIDKSKETVRNERYTIEEFQKIIKFFDSDPRIQAFLTIVQETFTRPQELLYLKVRDFQFFDNYGLATITEHGKVGCKTIQFENLSYPYVLKWFQQHPLKDDPNAYFFVNKGNRNKYTQMTNTGINKRIRNACKALGIDKRITCYSLKRMGITMDRMNGMPDKIIISKAGWTSAKQLSIYDLGTQDEALRMSLIRKGLVKPETLEEKKFQPKQRQCGFCQYLNSFTDQLCGGCCRPLDRKHIQAMEVSHQKLMSNELMSRIDKLETALQEKLEGSL
jgi:integrase